ncbi:MAG: hypothetical protein AB9873_02520 [Syntrophobacteraceae bacterium]
MIEPLDAAVEGGATVVFDGILNCCPLPNGGDKVRAPRTKELHEVPMIATRGAGPPSSPGLAQRFPKWVKRANSSTGFVFNQAGNMANGCFCL